MIEVTLSISKRKNMKLYDEIKLSLGNFTIFLDCYIKYNFKLLLKARSVTNISQ